MNTLMIRPLILITVLFSSCEGPVGPQGPTGATGSGGVELLTDPSIQPRVIDTYPPRNGIGPFADAYSNQIQVRFNKIMDRALMRKALALSSPNSSAWLDTSNLYTLGGDIFQIPVIDTLPDSYYHRWKLGELYTLSISSVAKDINGNVLQPFTTTFLPEPFFRVRSISPRHGSTNLPARSDIYLTFNSKVDTSIFASILINPPIPGGRWIIGGYYGYPIDSTVIQYMHSGLSNATTYTLTISPNAQDKYGNHLLQQFTSSFSTAAFRVSSTYPGDGSIDVPPEIGITVNCTGPIDTSSIRTAFTITPNISGSFSPSYSNSSFYFIHPQEFLPETTYTVRIDTSLRSVGGVRLSSEYTFSFVTSAFKVRYTYPSNGSTNVSRYLYGIQIVCNARIDTSSVRSAFSVPGLPGLLYLSDESSSFEFRPFTLPLPANTTYTVTISTAFRSKGGARLKAPYTFSFSTGIN